MQDVQRRTLLGAAWAAPTVVVASAAPAVAASPGTPADTVVLAFTPSEAPATVEDRRGFTALTLTNVGTDVFSGALSISVSQVSGPTVLLPYDEMDAGWSLRGSFLPTTLSFTGTISVGATTRIQLAPTAAPGNPLPWSSVISAQAVSAPTTTRPTTFTLRAGGV